MLFEANSHKVIDWIASRKNIRLFSPGQIRAIQKTEHSNYILLYVLKKDFNVVKFDQEKQCDHLTFVTKAMMELQVNCFYNDVAIVMQRLCYQKLQYSIIMLLLF